MERLSHFFSLLFSAQVSFAKVLLAVFGVAVVVILIAVPTAIFLNSEYWLLSDSHVRINAPSVVRRTVNPQKEGNITHASLRTLLNGTTLDTERECEDIQLDCALI